MTVGASVEPGASAVTQAVRLPPGVGPVATNIAGGPGLVQIEGMTPVGRLPDGRLAVQGASSSRPRIVTVRRTGGPKGRLASLLSLLSLLVAVGLAATARRWGRRFDRGPAPAAG